MSPVVAVSGVIPGAGATTTVAALGSALAEQRNHVALVDASPEGSRLAEVLSLPDGDRLADALRRSADLASVQVDGPHGTVCFPAAPETAWHSIRPGAVASLYADLRARFDVALVDCGSAVTPATAAWLGHADELVVVADADVADAAADRVAVGEALDTTLRGVVANRVVRDEAPAALNRLEASDQPVLAALPEDPTVGAAAGDRRSILEEDPDSAVATCTWELARRFASRDHDEPVVPTGWIDEDEVDPGRTEAGDVGGATADGSGATADGSGTTADGSEATADGSEAMADGSEATADGGTRDGTAADTRDGAAAGGHDGAAASTGSESTPATATSDASHGSSADRQPGSDSGESGSGGTADAFEFDRDGLESAGDNDADATSESGVDEPASESAVDEPATDASVAGTSAEGDDGDRTAESDGASPTERFGDVLRDSSGETGGRGTTDRDDASGGVDGSATGRTDGTGGTGAGTGDGGDGGEISDEEIEEVFKETLERVEEGDAEDASDGAGDADDGEEDDGDSLLSGFTDG